MSKKEIDVIIPAYNAHNTIGRTLSSIATQNISDIIKVTIVNDGSEKNYSEFINSFSTVLDIQEITLDKNVGCGMARQIGMDSTDCKYIMFIDADDMYLYPFSVFMLYRSMEHVYDENTLLDATYSCIDNVRMSDGETNYTIKANHGTWLHGAIYRRDFIYSKGIRFNDSSRGEDVGFNKLCKLCSDQYRLGTLNDMVLYLWTDANDNRINSKIFRLLFAKIGYVENLIYVYQFLDNNKEACTYSFDQMKIDAAANFVHLYMQYIELYHVMHLVTELMDVEEIVRNITEYIDLLKELYDLNYLRYRNNITDEDINRVYDANTERDNRQEIEYDLDDFYIFLDTLHENKQDILKQKLYELL